MTCSKTISGFYESKYQNVIWADYPYYLFSLFYLSLNAPSQHSSPIANEQNVQSFLKAAHDLVEALLVMLPRDIGRGVTVLVQATLRGAYDFLIDTDSAAFRRVLQFEKRYSDFAKANLINGIGSTFLSRVVYEKPTGAQGVQPIVLIGNYEQPRHVLLCMIRNELFQARDLDSSHKVFSVAQFVFTELLKDVSLTELSTIGISRAEFFILFVALTAFLLTLLDEQRGYLFDRKEFEREFLSFARAGCEIATFALDSQGIDLNGLDSKNVEQINRELLEWAYYQGLSKRAVLRDTRLGLSEVLARRSAEQWTARDDTDRAMSVPVAPTSIADIMPIAVTPIGISDSVFRSFMGWCFAFPDSRFPNSIHPNRSEIGFCHGDMVSIPNMNRPGITARMLLTVERLMHRVLKHCGSGTVTTKLGYRYERHVETCLTAAGFTVLHSAASDPDVLAIRGSNLYCIECKSWFENMELVFGPHSIVAIQRRARDVDRAKRQARGWAKKLPQDVDTSAYDVQSQVPVVIVPYPEFASPYTDENFGIEVDDVPVFNESDFISVVLGVERH